ncbi:helix-turn-helix transcriptional regulator [Vibrio sp. D404a]|uniref:AraC family transcriptional regulator n=1 Tax=unclassified Vibrio TaxID=2614977 RepID=UPI002552FF9C|nr:MULTISPECIES: AraC family transcriptional regulator [unclassified Vibrio]MDK9736812.1 helix-turn-helix transcriptional regulator [Vibrio sp. D404a]MDK9795770.1 helix-turn-helix transcriptional regulator [Vibrio sp. D449a]
MKRASKFIIPPNWKVLFNDLGLDVDEILAHAGLPQGLFDQQKVQLTPAQYFQIWHGIEAASKSIEIPLLLADVLSFESCDVPIYAAMCSDNLNAALVRLRDYKPLIGPLILDIETDDFATQLTFGCYGHEGKLPKNLNLTEMVFMTQLARMATRKHIQPIVVILPELPNQLDAYEAYFGCEVKRGEQAQIRFRAIDAQAPFLTNNQAMLNMFDNELKQRLEAQLAESTTLDRVSTVLIGSLPQGESSIEYVANQLAMSKRTLQRKLSDENYSYQWVLKKVRQELADYYLQQTQLPIIEVSFLLGFQEMNSFIRAYSSWTGTTPSQVRG